MPCSKQTPINVILAVAIWATSSVRAIAMWATSSRLSTYRHRLDSTHFQEPALAVPTFSQGTELFGVVLVAIAPRP